VAPGRRLLLLSHDGASPAEVARRHAELGYGASEIKVLEHMGGLRERIFSGRAEAWTHPRAADLNTLAVLCRASDTARHLSLSSGLPDDAFQHDGQLTKREIRAASLSALRPLPGQLLWDVGAGCGSIAIEWLRTHRSLSAIGIESDEGRRALITTNAAALGTPHLKLVNGIAPQAYSGLSDPDAVFIGGGLGDPGVVEGAWDRLKPGGRLGGEMTRLAVARLSPVGALHGWKPLMPVTQYWVDKR
jgi:precorrin-6Y C5,15-methyltransferase (decarboxylating)